MSEVAALYTAVAALTSACIAMFGVGLAMLQRELRADRDADRIARHAMADAVQALVSQHEVTQLLGVVKV